jgi:hypothetical protein
MHGQAAIQLQLHATWLLFSMPVTKPYPFTAE